MSEYQALRYAVSDAVAEVTLHRPDKMNAMDETMRRELTHAVGRAAEEARALLLTGAAVDGPRQAFCAGQDLGDIKAQDLGFMVAEQYNPLITALSECPIPTVAAVNGAAAGAGAHVAMCADIAIAAESARFVEPFAKIALMPAGGGSYWLVRRIGLARAMGACLLGQPISAHQALEWGLIWEVTADDAALSRGRAIAKQLSQGPTEAFRLTKQALRASAGNDLETQLALEAELQGAAGRTRDYLEGVDAFLEKRPPSFEGR